MQYAYVVKRTFFVLVLHIAAVSSYSKKNFKVLIGIAKKFRTSTLILHTTFSLFYYSLFQFLRLRSILGRVSHRVAILLSIFFITYIFVFIYKI